MKFDLIDILKYNNNIKYKKNISYPTFNGDNIEFKNIIDNFDYVNNLIKKEINFTKNFCDNIILYDIPESIINNLIIIECKNKDEINDYEYKCIIKKYINVLKRLNIEISTCFLTEIKVNNRNYEWKIKTAIQIIRDDLYVFTKFKKNENKIFVKKIIFIVNHNNYEKYKNIIIENTIISDAVDVTKNLCNLPSNICNSEYIKNECIKLCEENKNISCNFIDEKEMKKLGMNAYLSVSLGSKNKPIMCILEYNGLDKKNKPIVLIGKGITFDTGGISLKPSKDMDEMKFDMSGSGSVYGVIYAISKLKLSINVIGIMSISENSIDGKATRPGDIVKTMSGKTVEILNTDAEGRLILSDSISYSYKFNPSIIIDIATLTGACIISLGKHFSGLISNNDLLSNEIIKASNQSNDLVWRLPLIKEHQSQIDSNIADIKNIGNGEAGTITAACFLYNFVEKNTNWAHLDIAGSATNKNKQATGRPVYLLVQYLINKSKNI